MLETEIKKHVGISYVISETNETVYIDSRGASEYKGSNYTKTISSKVVATKTNATSEIENIIKIAKFDRHDIDHKPTQLNHGSRSNGGFNYYTTRFAVPVLDDNQNISDYSIYKARLIVAVGKDKILRLHDLDKINADRGALLKNSSVFRISASSKTLSRSDSVVNPENIKDTKEVCVVNRCDPY